MRDARGEGLAAALAGGRGDAFRRAYADLRETLACAIDPRRADRDVAHLLARYESSPSPTPVSARFEAVLRLLPGGELREAPRAGYDAAEPHPALSQGGGELLADGLETLLREHFGVLLTDVSVLDPWAGGGELLAAVAARAGTKRLWADVADPVRYAQASARMGPSFEGLCLADAFRLPDRGPTPGFAFTDDENTERIARQGETEFPAIVADLRGATRPDARAARRTREAYIAGLATVRWMTDRLAPEGIVAFLSDGTFVDEPGFAEMRACLEREFALVAHLDLPEGLALTFLVRGGRGFRLVVAQAESIPARHDGVEWTERQPTESHVWRTEILRPEWAEFLALAGERGAIFNEAHSGAADGRDAAAPGAKGARWILRRPFTPAWRAFDRKARREPPPIEGPTIVVLAEPFGVMASAVPVDRRFGGGGTTARAIGGGVAASAMRRFRAAYGAGVVERDVFDAALALLHHPEYPLRYREDLRRGVPRLPLPDAEGLEILEEAEDAPPVGPETAFGTGWLDADLFEPGVLPDYDDPFASPYARADVEPGFLLLVGLGAALYRLQVDVERLRPYPLAKIGEDVPAAMRLSADRTRVIGVLEGIPAEASAWRVGGRSALEWAVEASRPRRDFDPCRADDPERPVRLVGQVVAAAREVNRLVEILRMVKL